MEDFVSFEIAKKLKEKGFKEECLSYYTSDYTLYNNMVVLCDDKYLEVAEIDYNEFLTSNNSVRENKDNNICDAPTISQVLKWLRDEFSLHISQKPYACKDGLMWMYEIRKFNKRIVFVIANKTGFVEEEEASLAGIEYVIDNLI